MSRSGGGGRFSSFAVNDDNADDAASDTDSVDVLEPNVEYIQVKVIIVSDPYKVV